MTETLLLFLQILKGEFPKANREYISTTKKAVGTLRLLCNFFLRKTTTMYLMKQFHVNFSFCFPRVFICLIVRRENFQHFSWLLPPSLPRNVAMAVRMATLGLSPCAAWPFQLCYSPDTFSWNMTFVPFRKFLPMRKTSSSPFTEQLCKLFLRISGTPAGWATEE